MKWILLGTLLATGLPADASELYRCVGEAKAVAIQDHPCSASQRTSWVRQADRDERSPEEWDRIREERDRRNEDARNLARAAGTDSMYSNAEVRRSKGSRVGATKSRTLANRCELAKVRRQAILDKRRDDVKFDLRRSLNDEVFDACK